MLLTACVCGAAQSLCEFSTIQVMFLMKADCKLIVTTEPLFEPVCVACVAVFMAVVV